MSRGLGARGRAFFGALAFVVLGLCGAGVAHAQREPEVTRATVVARIVASAGVHGHFLDPVCDESTALAPAEEGLFTYAVTRAARWADHPLVLDAGGLLTPNGVMRYAAAERPAAVADMVQDLGYRALAFGRVDLGAPRERMLGVVHELRLRNIPMIATNLRCVGEEAVPLCDALVDASDGISMHRALEARVAVLALLDEDALQHVSPDLASGLAIDPIPATLEARVLEARRQGADVVVAVLQLGTDEALDVTSALPDDARPDVVVLSMPTHLFTARPTTVRPLVVAPRPGDAALVVVRDEDGLRISRSATAEPLAMRGISTGEPVLDLADEIGEAYCDAWGHVLAGAHLARPIDPPGIALLAAQIARERASADVAVVNVGAVDPGWRPAREGSLTESDVYVALPYDEPLVMADVSRAWIEALAHHAAERGLVTPGLEASGSVRIDGRAPVTRMRYRVVTLRFLAMGGDAALADLDPDDPPDWQPVDDATLRSVVRDALERRDSRDPRDVRADPAERPEWLLSASLDGTFAGSSISNPGYDVAALNRSSTVSLGLEVNLGASASAPDWTWENTFVLRYRSQWQASSTPMTSGAFNEAVDQTQLRSTASWRGFRTASGSREWYVPDPYLEAFVETELTQPAARNFHWFLVRPLVGLRFTLMPELDVKLDVGFQTQALAGGLIDTMGRPEDTIDGGLGAVVTLRPWDLIRDGDRHTTISGTADFFWSDPLTRNLWQLRGQLDAQIDLAGPLSLTLGVRLYLQQDRQVALGTAIDATAGLRVSSVGRVTGP